MIKAVIFDMDGVLIDTEKHYNAAWCEAAHMAGFADFERAHALMLRSCDAGAASEMMKDIFGAGFDYYAIREVRRRLVAERLEKYGLEKKPGIDEILAFLHERKIKSAVATATPIELALQYLGRIGVKDQFDRIVSGCLSLCLRTDRGGSGGLRGCGRFAQWDQGGVCGGMQAGDGARPDTARRGDQTAAVCGGGHAGGY